MRIRLRGTRAEVDAYASDLRVCFDVVDESEDYPDRPPSKLLRRYLDIRHRDDQHRVIGAILAEVGAERHRQLTKWGVQHRANDTGGARFRNAADQARAECQAAESSGVAGGAGWSLVLAEEVAEAFAETDRAALRTELVQVAAVCAAWIEDLDSRSDIGPEPAARAM